MEILEEECSFHLPQPGFFRKIGNGTIRIAIRNLLKWFPNEVITNGINDFFRYIIDDENALNDPMYLDAFVNRVANHIKEQMIGRKSNPDERSNLRKYLKNLFIHTLPSGALNSLYVETNQIIQNAIIENILKDSLRIEKLKRWLTEASKAITALTNKEVEQTLKFGTDAEFLEQLQPRTQNTAVALFLMEILENQNRHPILMEINSIIWQIYRIERNDY